MFGWIAFSGLFNLRRHEVVSESELTSLIFIRLDVGDSKLIHSLLTGNEETELNHFFGKLIT